MRIRRKAWARPELESCRFCLEYPYQYKYCWRDIFNNARPIHLELGCGKGIFISKLARDNKLINYVGIDIKSEMLAIAKRNIENYYASKSLSVDNIYLFSYDIRRINYIFSTMDNVRRIYINFCNPWPKPRHYKNRLTHPRQLSQYVEFLEKGSEIWFKTDDDELFTDSINYFKSIQFNFSYITYDINEFKLAKNIATEHERIFINQGKKIKFLIATI